MLDKIQKYHIDNFNFNDKKVILRVDWNIPTKDNTILDDYRIVSSLPTIFRILKDEPKYIIIISHFGRPESKNMKYSWLNYITKIQEYFKYQICLLKDGLCQNTLEILNENKYKLYLLENIRFHIEETEYLKILKNESLKNESLKNDNECINVIQKLGDFYVNDAFGCMHRNHLSICGIKLQDKAYGYLVDSELNALKILLENKENKKILAIIGGAKVNDKLPLLEELSKKVDSIYIAGGNINGILKDMQMSKFIQKIRNENKAQIHLMCDGYGSTNYPNDKKINYYKSEELPLNINFYDIGNESLLELKYIINNHDIIFWNGTLGIVEDTNYELGSNELVQLLIKSNKQIIIGGGDTAGYVNKFQHNFYFISTGGGAVIDYISNGSLVGIDYFK